MTQVDPVYGETCAGVAQFLETGSGIAWHLGKFTVQNNIYYFATQSPSITGVMTATNGDQILTYVNDSYV